MPKENINGALLIAQKATMGTVVTTGDLAANTWYRIKAKAASPAIPDWEEGAIFKTPDAGSTPITLATGDEVWPLTLETICKTECKYSFEKGTIEVTDDCPENGGYVAMIVDGFVDISGDLNGFMKVDETTKALVDASQDLLKRFVDVATDDSDGVYTYTPKNDDIILFFLCLNKDAAVGENQNWLILPIHLTSMSGGAALKDAQKKDISWVKAPGPATLYIRVVGSSADVL